MTGSGYTQASQGNTKLTRCVGGIRPILASVKLNRIKSKTKVGEGSKWDISEVSRMLNSTVLSW